MEFVKQKFGNQSIIGAEVGIAGGNNASDILQNMPNIRCLYLIDPYKKYDGLAQYQSCSNNQFKGLYEKAKSKLDPFHNRIRWVFKKFEECTRKDVSDALDFVYVDGNHTYDYVKQDIGVATALAKVGAVIGGHDWGWSGNRSGVKRAVKEYAEKYNTPLSTGGGDWWFINIGVHPASITLKSEAADQLLETVDDVAESLGFKMCLTDGTCLGFVRDGGYIPYDGDLDVAVIADFETGYLSESDYQKLGQELRSRNLKISGQTEIRSGEMFQKYYYQKWHNQKVLIDIQYRPNHVLHYDLYKARAKKFGGSLPYLIRTYKKFDKVTHNGRVYNVPYPVEEYLRMRYGNWRFSEYRMY